MRFLSVVIVPLFLSAPAALAQSDLSRSLAEHGLAATVSQLEQMPARDATQSFALAGCLFLRAIEKTLQTRYRYNLGGGEIEDFPILRLPFEPNPNPEAFDPGVVTAIFESLTADMEQARVPLSQITDDDAVALDIALKDIWFDIDGSGTRDAAEGLMAVTGGTFFDGWSPQASAQDTLPAIRFDTSDAAWLGAYTHLLSGLGELVLAYAPTEAIRDIHAASQEMSALMPDAQPDYLNAMITPAADHIAMLYYALQQQPDPQHTRAAKAHLLAMIGENQRFWKLVESETDNDSEWIPSSRQISALGIAMPPETGARWLAVLDDAKALLEGEKLVPHWRLGEAAAGINLARLLDDPIPVDIVGWIHGAALLPYIEPGIPVSAENWRQFEWMLSGDAPLMALWLN